MKVQIIYLLLFFLGSCSSAKYYANYRARGVPELKTTLAIFEPSSDAFEMPSQVETDSLSEIEISIIKVDEVAEIDRQNEPGIRSESNSPSANFNTKEISGEEGNLLLPQKHQDGMNKESWKVLRTILIIISAFIACAIIPFLFLWYFFPISTALTMALIIGAVNTPCLIGIIALYQ